MPEESEDAKSLKRRDRKRKSKLAVRRKKEFSYRGLSLDKLQLMSFEQILAILPARARRSFKRGLSEENKKIVEYLKKAQGPVKTHRRDLIILPQFVGRKFLIHNGKEYKELEIKPEMIGHYIGEFAMTRKPVKHTGPGVGATRSSKYMPLR